MKPCQKMNSGWTYFHVYNQLKLWFLYYVIMVLSDLELLPILRVGKGVEQKEIIISY